MDGDSPNEFSYKCAPIQWFFLQYGRRVRRALARWRMLVDVFQAIAPQITVRPRHDNSQLYRFANKYCVRFPVLLTMRLIGPCLFRRARPRDEVSAANWHIQWETWLWWHNMMTSNDDHISFFPSFSFVPFYLFYVFVLRLSCLYFSLSLFFSLFRFFLLREMNEQDCWGLSLIENQKDVLQNDNV